jgi:hypothetical protein
MAWTVCVLAGGIGGYLLCTVQLRYRTRRERAAFQAMVKKQQEYIQECVAMIQLAQKSLEQQSGRSERPPQ